MLTFVRKLALGSQSIYHLHHHPPPPPHHPHHHYDYTTIKKHDQIFTFAKEQLHTALLKLCVQSVSPVLGLDLKNYFRFYGISKTTLVE